MAKRKAGPKTKKAARKAGKKAKKAAPKKAVRKAPAAAKAPARKIKKKAAARKAVPRKAVKAKKGAKPAARRAVAGKKAKKVMKAVKPRPAARPAVRPVLKKAAKPAATAQTVERRAPALDRARRVVLDDDIVMSPPSTLDMDRRPSAARSGGRALHDRIERHHDTSPALTAGDVDADWESAESSGEEAPGGDNMTPDQDVVDEIGAALGVEYDDDEELQGGAEIAERDEHRWDDEDS